MELSRSKEVKFNEEIIELPASPRFNLSTSHREFISNDNQNSCDNNKLYQTGCVGRTPQEMAGIMVNYPGITEHKRRYKWPHGDIEFESIINPGYEGLFERIKIKNPEPVEQISEYNRRFVWP